MITKIIMILLAYMFIKCNTDYYFFKLFCINRSLMTFKIITYIFFDIDLS